MLEPDALSGSTRLFDEIKGLTTEARNPTSLEIDDASVETALHIIHEADREAVEAVKDEIPHVEKAVELIAGAIREGGTLLYVGAGTSGRLGVLDAAECPPTFGTHPDQVRGLIAGGKEAMFEAQEGAEDLESNGAAAIDESNVSEKDVVCGIAASRRTPYVVGALKRAKELGAATLLVTCNPRSDFESSSLAEIVDVAMCPDVGPEVIMGSTRMKSGTATKLILNMLTTVSMIQLGKVYQNMMVDLQMTNQKLVERSKRIVMIATGLDYQEAERALDDADGHVKTALVMVLADVGIEEAKARIERGDGFVRRAIEQTSD